jgi:P-type conjugative transfer protein TrbJ
MIGFKKAICILTVIVFTLSGSSSIVIAGGGGVGGGAKEFTQILNNSELAAQVKNSSEQIAKAKEQIDNQMKQISRLVEQIDNQVMMIKDLFQNTLSLPQQLFGNVTQIYSRIKGLMDQTKGIAYTMMNLDEEMKNRFQSYSNMSGSDTMKNFQEEYRKIVDTQMETTRTTLETIGVAWDQLEKDDTKTLQQLQNIAKNADGRNKIMQSTNQFLGFLSEESLKLRQLIMLQTQMTGVALEAERAKQDAAQLIHEESALGILKSDPFHGDFSRNVFDALKGKP